MVKLHNFKHLAVVLASVVCWLVFSTIAYADGTSGDYVTEYRTNMANLRMNNSQKLITAMEKGLEDNNDRELKIAKYSIKKAYTDILTKEMMIKSYSEWKNFESMKTDSMEWIICIENESGKKGYAVLVREGYDFKLEEVIIDEESPRLEIDVDEVAAIVQGNSDGGVTDCGVYYSKLYKTSLVYWNDNDGLFVVPYSEISGKCKIKNGVIYTLSDYMTQMNKVFDENRYKEGSYKLAYRIHFVQIGGVVAFALAFSYLATSGIRRRIKTKIAKKRLAKKYDN